MVRWPWARNNPPQVQPHLTNSFKRMVREQARIIKQDVYKDGWMRTWITSRVADAKNIPDYEAATIGDLGPTPEFIIRGLTDRENNRSFGEARDYYTNITYLDITNQIMRKPQILRRAYEFSEGVLNAQIEQLRQAGEELTDAEKREMRRGAVRDFLLKSYYADKGSLMGDIQRDAIVNQSLMVSVARNMRRRTLRKFRPDYLMDLFPDGILPYTSKRILQLRSRGSVPEDIKKQIQVEEDFFRARNLSSFINDSNLSRFNTFINACFAQALADEGGMPELDIDQLLALDQTYALDAEHKNMKERAQRIMRHQKDPKTAYMWYMLEQDELRRRENWWRNYV